MEYKVKINEFEGPLDLLLHLIKEADIDIYEIKISEITEQYLDYIKAMEELNLVVASEYLVMAAELLEMKSRSLLPRKEQSDDDEFEEDPKEQLIKKLLDYKHYKEITAKFKELESIRGQVYSKLPSSIDEYKSTNFSQESHSISLLLDAFNQFMERSEQQKPLHTKVATKEFSIDERIDKIRKILHTKKEISFNMLFEYNTKDYIIVTFLAILQMTKDQEITIEQNDDSDIYIKLRGSA